MPDSMPDRTPTTDERSFVRSQPPYSTEAVRGWIPWRALTPVLGLLFVALPVLGFSPALQSLGLENAKHDPVGFAGLVAFLVVAFAATGILVFLWVHFVERRSFATIGLGGREGDRPAATLLRGHAIGIATACVVVAAIALAGGYASGAIGPAFASGAALVEIAVFLLCFVVQAGVEEILFRGWMLSAGARRGHPAVAVALSTLLFTFLHWSPRQPLLSTANTILFALFACAWALRAGNIWGVMGWHAGWNWMMGVGFEIPITGFDLGVPALLVELTARGPDSLTGGADGPEGSLACCLFFVVAISWLWWRRDRGPLRSPAPAA
jgi:membrane protease YdiL (CAAX protease family)